jgi:DNA-binding NtrC family response regulator
MSIDLPANDGFRRQTVLIVDDEPDISGSLKTLIEGAIDVEVVCAGSGEAALRILDTSPVDLIISDFKMPGMDGLEFLHRAQQSTPRTPRMLMTAFPDLDLALRAINEEAVRNVLVKPFDIDVVLDNVLAVLLDRRADEIQARSFARAMNVLRRDPR